MTPDQLQAARAADWRQTQNPLLTLEDAQAWLTRHPLCLYLPRKIQLPAPAPTFVEATLGRTDATPPAADLSAAHALLERLTVSGDVVALNLLGTVTEQPDFLVHPDVLPFVLRLRSDPDRKGSPLSQELAKLLEKSGGVTLVEAREALGRELSEAAVLRALCDLWQSLRISPVWRKTGEAPRWELLRLEQKKAFSQATSTTQVTALSLVVSSYLQSVYAATAEEIEIFISPLAARSRIREAVRGLAATRQIHSLSMDAQTYFFLENGLPEFAPVAPEPEESEAGSHVPVRTPVERTPAPTRPFRSPREDKRPAREVAAFPREGTRRPASPRPFRPAADRSTPLRSGREERPAGRPAREERAGPRFVRDPKAGPRPARDEKPAARFPRKSSRPPLRAPQGEAGTSFRREDRGEKRFGGAGKPRPGGWRPASGPRPSGSKPAGSGPPGSFSKEDKRAFPARPARQWGARGPRPAAPGDRPAPANRERRPEGGPRERKPFAAPRRSEGAPYRGREERPRPKFGAPGRAARPAGTGTRPAFSPRPQGDRPAQERGQERGPAKGRGAGFGGPGRKPSRPWDKERRSERPREEKSGEARTRERYPRRPAEGAPARSGDRSARPAARSGEARSGDRGARPAARSGPGSAPRSRGPATGSGKPFRPRTGPGGRPAPQGAGRWDKPRTARPGGRPGAPANRKPGPFNRKPPRKRPEE